MDLAVAQEFLEEVNSKADAAEVIKRIGYATDKMQIVGDSIKAFCPIHKDKKFRSLLVESGKQSFKCTLKTCAGARGGTVVQLYALARKIEPLSAAAELIGALDLAVDAEWTRKIAGSILEEAQQAFVRQEPEKAESAARQALKLQPDLDEARMLLANMHAERGESSQAVEEYSALVETYLAKEQFQDADKILESALGAFPDNVDLLFLQVRSAELQKDTKRAIALMKQIVSHNEESNRHADNFGVLQKIAELDPKDSDVHVRLADIYERRHEMRAASKSLEHAAKLLKEQGRNTQAIPLLEKVLQLSPEMAKTRLDLAEELIRDGDYARAKEQIFEIANQQIENQNYAAAEKTVNRWLEVEPESAEVHESLARIYMDQERHPEAGAELEKAASIVLKDGDEERGLQLLFRIKFVTPDNLDVRRKIIELFEKQKETHRAGFELLDLAEVLFSKDEPIAAEKALHHAAELSDSLQVKQQVADALLSHGREEAAVKMFGELLTEAEQRKDQESIAAVCGCMLRLRPDDLKLAHKRALALWDTDVETAAAETAHVVEQLNAAGERDRAIELLRKGAEHAADYSDDFVECLRHALAADDPVSAGKYYTAVINTVADLDSEQAMEYAAAMSALDPEHPTALADVGVLYASHGKTREAAETYVRLAQRLSDRDELEAAIQNLEEALAVEPGHLAALGLRAHLVARLHGTDDALPYYEEYVGAVRERGTGEELLSALSNYLELYPGDLSAHMEAAQQMRVSDKSAQALEKFLFVAGGATGSAQLELRTQSLQQAAELSPHDAGIRDRLGAAYAALESSKEAADAYQGAAKLYLQTQNLNAAHTSALRAVELAGDSIPLLEMLSQIEERLSDTAGLASTLPRLVARLRAEGRISAALEQATRLLNLDPRNLDSRRIAAELHAEDGDTDQALSEYTALIEDYEKSEDYPAALAIHAEMAQLRAPDIKTLERLVRLSEKAGPSAAAEARLQLGQALLAAGDVPGAFNTAKQLGKQKTGLASAAMLLQRIAQAAGTQEEGLEAFLAAAEAFKKAGSRDENKISCLESALALDPENPTAHQLLAEHYESAGEPDFAFTHRVALLPTQVKSNKDTGWKTELGRLRQLASNDAGKHMELGRRVLRSEQVADALLEFERATELALESSDSQMVLEAADAAEAHVFNSTTLCRAKFDALIQISDKPGALEWLRECAQQALRADRAAEAEEYAQRWVELERADPDALELLAAAYQKQGRTQKAVETYMALANVLKFAGDYERAIAILRQALLVDPEAIPARQLLWQVLLEAEKQNDALQEMQQLADLFIERQAYREASTLLSRILDYRTNSEQTLERLACLVHEHEGFSKASPYFRKLLQLKRSTLPADEMAAEYERVLKLEGADAEVRAEYADFLKEQGLLPDAKQQYLHIAQVYRDELNEPQNAIHYLHCTLELLPANDDSRVYEELANLHESLSEPAPAVGALRRAAELYSASGEGKKAAQAIRKALSISIPEDRLLDEALLAQASAAAGEKKKARDAFEQAFTRAQSPEASADEATLRRVYEILLQIDPEHTASALALIPLLPPADVVPTVTELRRTLASAGRVEDEVRLLKAARAAAPRDAQIRRDLIDVYRTRGDSAKLQFELADYARTAIQNKHVDDARTSLKELASLPATPELMMQLASLYDLLEDREQTAASYCGAAELFEQAGQNDDAVDALRHALQADANSVPAALIATLARKGGADVRKIARDILEAALIARTRTRSLVVATALLERDTPEDARRLLSMVFMRAGASFLSAIAGAHADGLLEQGRNDDAKMVTEFITDLAPNSPDVWWLASQLKKRYGDKTGSAEAALKAAQLFNEAGAISEEESCYREVLEEIPDDAATLQTLAYFYEREKRGEEGVEVMRRLSALLGKSGDTTGAITWLRKALELAPTNHDARAEYARALDLSNKHELAMEQWLETGKHAARAGAHDPASSAYERVLELEPTNEQAVSYLLDAATRNSDTENMNRLMLVLSEIKAESGAVVQACQLLKNLISRQPDNLEALEKLSAFSQLAHDFTTHREAAQKLGNHLLKRGEYVQAITQFESALEHDSENLELLQTLIDCCAGEGLTDRGRQYAQRLLDIAKAAGDPERVRVAASSILGYDEQNSIARRELAESLLCLNKVQDAVAEWYRAAEHFQAAKQPAQALDCYRRIVQVSPGQLQAWRKLGDLSIANGDPDAARGAYLHLLESYTESGETEKTDAIIGRLLQLDPEDIELHKEAMEAYRKAGRHEHAMEQVLWLVRRAMADDQPAEAERLVEIGNTIAPDSLALQQCQLEIIKKLGRTDELQVRLRQLADQSVRTGELSKTADILEQMKEVDPGNLELRKELAGVHMQLGNTPPAIVEYCHILRELITRQETEEARNTAEELSNEYPDLLEMRARIAEVFASNGMADVGSKHFLACSELARANEDPQAQIHFLRLAVQARPRWAEGHEKLAEAASAAEDIETAYEAFRNLAELLIEGRKFPQAALVLKKQIELDDKNTQPRVRIAELFERTGEKEQQFKALEDLADLYIKEGSTDDALTAFKRMTTLRPNEPDVLQRYVELFAQVGNEREIVGDYIRLGNAYASKGAVDQAIQTFEQAAAIDPRNPEVHEHFSSVLLTHGHKGRAFTEMRKLADIYVQKGDPNAAVEVLHAALALDSQNAELCLLLAGLQQKAGLREEALASYARATSILSGTTAMKGIDVFRRMLAQDEENTEVRKRLCDLLVRAGENRDAAANARRLAEIHCGRGELNEAEDAYRMASELEPESTDVLRRALQESTHDPSLQYMAYIRLGDRLFEEGDIDAALDAFRNARSLNDERPQVIQRCIDCMSLIAPEAEAIPDYIALAERHMSLDEPELARAVYEHIGRLDPFNADARTGLTSALHTEKAPETISNAETQQDRRVLGRQERTRRIGLEELLSACKEAASEQDA